MIKAKYAAPVLKFFHWYIPFIFQRDFHCVEIHGTEDHFPNAILVIANHFSWWDAFILFYLNERRFKKRYHVMMLEEQLRKFQLFNYGGVYSVKKKTKDIIESLQYTIELLKDSANMALLFPQGEIQSQHLQQLHFQKGLAYLIKHTATGYHIVFTASLTDYFSNRKPSLHIFYEEYTINRSAELITIENAYNNFYSNCKLTLQNMHTTN